MGYSRKIIGKNRNLKKRSRKGGMRGGGGEHMGHVSDKEREHLSQRAHGPAPEPKIINGKYNTLILKFNNESDIEKYLMSSDVLGKLDTLKKENRVIKTIILYIESERDFNGKINSQISFLNDMAFLRGMWIDKTNVQIPPPDNIFERTLYYLDGYAAIIINVENQQTYTPTAHGGKFGFLKYNDGIGREKLLCIERHKPVISGFGGSPNIDEATNPKKTVIREMMEELFAKMHIPGERPTDDNIKYYTQILQAIGINSDLDVLSVENLDKINLTEVCKAYFDHKLPMGGAEEHEVIKVKSWSTFYFLDSVIPLSEEGKNLHDFCEEMHHDIEVKSILSIDYKSSNYKTIIDGLSTILENKSIPFNDMVENLKIFVSEHKAIMKEIFFTNNLEEFNVSGERKKNGKKKIEITYEKDSRNITLIKLELDGQNNIIDQIGGCQMWPIMKTLNTAPARRSLKRAATAPVLPTAPSTASFLTKEEVEAIKTDVYGGRRSTNGGKRKSKKVRKPTKKVRKRPTKKRKRPIKKRKHTKKRRARKSS